jgi:hypothetical protein
MVLSRASIAMAAVLAVVIRAPVALAQSPTALERAELAGLTPEVREQAQAKAAANKSMTNVLREMILNNIEVKHPLKNLTIRVIAVDWDRGVAVVQSSRGGMRAFRFNPATLQIE